MSNIAKIKKYCIANGEGLRTAIFFSGCDHHCKGCFNKELWNYDCGKPFDMEEILSTIDEHTSGISLLGGDPLCGDNANTSILLCKEFKKRFPDKTIWLWTGYLYEEVKDFDFNILDYIDYGESFEKFFIQPLQNMAKAMGYEMAKKVATFDEW